MKDWIVIQGTIINTTTAPGGFEFIGPFTEEEAFRFRERNQHPDCLTIAVQLLPSRQKMNV